MTTNELISKGLQARKKERSGVWKVGNSQSEVRQRHVSLVEMG